MKVMKGERIVGVTNLPSIALEVRSTRDQITQRWTEVGNVEKLGSFFNR
jgi:hypothetical protein